MAHPLGLQAEQSQLPERSGRAASGAVRQPSCVGWEKLLGRAPAALGSMLVLRAYAMWTRLQASMQSCICVRRAMSREVSVGRGSVRRARALSPLDASAPRWSLLAAARPRVDPTLPNYVAFWPWVKGRDLARVTTYLVTQRNVRNVTCPASSVPQSFAATACVAPLPPCPSAASSSSTSSSTCRRYRAANG